MKKTLTTLLFTTAFLSAHAQWSKANPQGEITKKSESSTYYKLDIEAIRSQLAAADKAGKNVGSVIIEIPTAEGIERFSVNSFPVMDEALASQYQLGSYVGKGVDDPSKYIRFSVAPNDFQSMMISNGKYEFIDAATSDKTVYSIHQKSSKEGHAFACSTSENPLARAKMKKMQKASDNTVFARSGNKKFHTLRLALSTTAEYTNYFGGVAGALTQMNATLTRVNGVFEQEFNLHMNMINAPGLIFTNASTDPYSNASGMDNWSLQLMNTLHGGSFGVTDADFDIGHLFGATGGGGNAGCLECVCSNDTTTELYDGVTYPVNYKGSAYTSPSSGNPPSGDSFDIDYVAHEFGHQLGGSHNHSEYEDYKNKEVEPGTGSTIMGYAGLWGPNSDVQPNSDPYFSHTSIEQVQIHLADISCDVETNIANNPPVITAMPTVYTIPKATAFVLTATATDPDGDALTYTWEQSDPSKLANGITKTNLGNTTSGGSFRSLSPTSNPTRFFPKLATVLGGAVKNTTNWEAASTVARTTNFTVTARDNKPGGEAQTAAATQRIVVGAAAAFKVNAASGVAGNPVNVTWVVSGTTASPYNVANVKIDYTTDAGATWNVLAASTPNTGTASVTFPATLGASTPHVRVSAIGNVFYAVNKVTLTAPSLGVNDADNKSVQVYPNPATEVLYAKNVSSKSTYEIHNAAGQLVAKGNVNNGEIKVNSLLKGAYVISFTDNGNSFKTKFIKK